MYVQSIQYKREYAITKNRKSILHLELVRMEVRVGLTIEYFSYV